MDVFKGVPLNATISFKVYPATILGDMYNYVRMVAVYDYNTARQFIDADAMHRAVISSLPDTVPDDPKEYSYIKIIFPSGDSDVIGKPWVEEESILLHGTSTIKFIIDNVLSEDIVKINTLLESNGYTAKEWQVS